MKHKCGVIRFDKEGNRIITPKQMKIERFKMVKTLNQGYIPTPYDEFVKEVIDNGKDETLLEMIERCNCGKGKSKK
jgi:hypothetical protein